MIIDCIADTHGFFPTLEGGDLLIVAGDLTARDTEFEYLRFFEWLTLQKYQKIIFIGGNHDNYLEKNKPNYCKNIQYLCDSGTEFEYEEIDPHDGRMVSNAFINTRKKLKIWGSPWTKRFPGMNPNCMAFTVDTDEQLSEKWALFPDDIDILITHSPPMGILDQVKGEYIIESVGSESLLNKIRGSCTLKLHIFGHIHEHGGEVVTPGHLTKFVNASHVNDRYQPVNKPIRIEL